MANFQLFFSVQGKGDIRWGPDPENRVDVQDTGSPVGQFLLGYKDPVSQGIFVHETDPLGDLPAAWAFFLQYFLQLHRQS